MSFIKNNWSDAAREASLRTRRANAKARAVATAIEDKWGAAAREASLRTRRAKAEARAIATAIAEIEAAEGPLPAEVINAIHQKHGLGVGANPEIARQRRMSEWPSPWGDQFSSSKKEVWEPFVDHWVPRGADGATVPSRYNEETGELTPLPYDEWPEHLRNDPTRALREGDVIDPHYRGWLDIAIDAPYGLNDVTGEPREEPLYTMDGIPIVPKFPESIHPATGVEQDSVDAQRFQQEQALFDWGKFGQKKEWMDANPGKDWRDYNAYMREKFGDEAEKHAPELKINPHNLRYHELSTKPRKAPSPIRPYVFDDGENVLTHLHRDAGDVLIPITQPGMNVDRDILDDVVRTITGSSQGIPTKTDVDNFIDKTLDDMALEIAHQADTIDDIYQTIFGATATDIGQTISEKYHDAIDSTLDPESKFFTARQLLEGFHDSINDPRNSNLYKSTYSKVISGPREPPLEEQGRGERFLRALTRYGLPIPGYMPEPVRYEPQNKEIRAVQAAARAKAARRAELEKQP